MKPGKGRLPRVSFIIPTLNSSRTIERCLKSIKSQVYNGDIEIIIVDGGSIDGTLEVVSRYADKVIMVKGTLGLARRKGSEEAKGEILGIFDSDIYLPHKKWLMKAVSRMINEGISILWPINIPPKEGSTTSKAYFSLWMRRLVSSKDPLPGGNILILSEAYFSVGGISKELHFGEDYDLTSKVLKKRYVYSIHTDPIIHDTMKNLKEYTRKQFWGARALISAPDHIIRSAISWSEGDDLLKSVFKHIRDFLFSIPVGIYLFSEYKIILYLPIMLLIRLFIYGSVFLPRRFLRRARK